MLFATLDQGLGLLSITFSIFALAVSLLTLWMNYFRPFKPVFLLAPPNLRFYHYKLEYVMPYGIRKFPVWNPTLHFTMSVYNSGVRPGRIKDIRIRVHSKNLSIVFKAEYVYDSAKLESFRRKKNTPPADPFEMRKAIEEKAWHGYLVPKDKPVQESLVFFTTIDGLRGVPLGHFTFTVEYFSETKLRWIQISEYEFEIDDWSKKMLEAGDGIILSAKDAILQPTVPEIDHDNLILDKEIENALMSDG